MPRTAGETRSGRVWHVAIPLHQKGFLVSRPDLRPTEEREKAREKLRDTLNKFRINPEDFAG
jgi:hypothetical protein